MLNIVFSSNDAYSPLLTIALTSLLENNSQDFDLINVYIVDNGISNSNRDKISRLCEEYPCNLTFVKGSVIESMDFSLAPMGENPIAPSSFTTYNRLFLSTLLPDDVDRIIYLDCDGLVIGSFKQLWDTDISNYYCAGVIQIGFTQALKDEFWFFNVKDYINAGFLYINLKKWREDNVEEMFIEFLFNHQNQYFCADQGVLNKTFEGKIKIIEPKYNLIGEYQEYYYDYAKKLNLLELDYYSKETIKDSEDNPVFVHFAGEITTPWFDCKNKYYPVFEEYARKCDCKSIIQCRKPIFRFNKIKPYILKLLVLFAPSKLLIKRNERFAFRLFRNEELKAQKHED